MNDDDSDGDMEWACMLCGFRTPETTVFDRHFYDAHPVEWEMAELMRGQNQRSSHHD
ncbi:hypothetical protein [Mycobacterium sp.]|uniref:hypothetical protein n=1 Tax=Mycobacterium sp. TaxID=1785 RepID=UPI003F968BF5